ncbi:cyclic nucleotide-binding domain protein (macronuclear) [Tetrahymena thermophila SB210]|uniref:Cyclic nucleotide-binding domain protein n=1 Tax=Tetrahymena thermophila (strain SB210) TaxID=312017 RepID=I7ME38_TETTS|nr:cyclic nucleotide-binding domain protein [Tetrahymena thermophila SB210]EAR94186.2 cyclic nucleotide-binding domain protein [Tetrahymena thermophila SB210]|eukprot:XP_001014431.2 cyclic nucleotide-binding domain protein [Tetrahymena thermophila SB210]
MDSLIENDTDFLDFKEKNREEIKQREQVFGILIDLFQNDSNKTENANQISKILQKSELANPKYDGQQKEEILSQIIKSIPKWHLKTYKKGEFIYHFGEDAQRVYLVIKGEAMQLKPKEQNDLQKEIQENKLKLQVVNIFKSNSNVGSKTDLKIQQIMNRRSQVSQLGDLFSTNLKVKSQDDLTISEFNSINKNESLNNNFQQSPIKKLQQTCLNNSKFQILKKSQSQLMKLTGFKLLLQNQLQNPELKDLYFDNQTYTFKFQLDIYLNSGELFGKSAVKEDSCRMTTVVVKSEEFYVLEISKLDYLKVFQQKISNEDEQDDDPQSPLNKKNSIKQQKYQLFLSVFDNSSINKLKKFISFFQYQTFPQNYTVWKRGQAVDKMYIILSGRVEISDDSLQTDQSNYLNQNPLAQKKQKKKQVIYETGKGNFFGEFEVIDKLEERLFTVRTLEETQVFGIHLNDFRLCENIVPQIVEQLVLQCSVKKSWVLVQKSKIQQTLDQYEKNKILNSQKQEVKDFLLENQKSIKEIQIDSFSDHLIQSNSSSPVLNRANDIKKLKENLKLQLNERKDKKGSSSQLSPVLNNNNKQSHTALPSPNKFFFSSSQIPRQYLQIDLFRDDSTENERKQSKSPTQKQKNYRPPSVTSVTKRNGMKSTSPIPLIPMPIDTDKSTQVQSTQMRSQNSPLSPLDKDNFFFGQPINVDEASPIFHRKVLKLNKLQLKQEQQHSSVVDTFSQQVQSPTFQNQLLQNTEITNQNQNHNFSPSKILQGQVKKLQNITNNQGINNENQQQSLLLNRHLKIQKRANSQPKLFTINSQSQIDNSQIQQQQQSLSKINEFHASVSSLVDEIQPLEINLQNNEKLLQIEQVFHNDSNNLKNQDNRNQRKLLKTQSMNSKLKYAISQQKENRKYNLYKINLDKQIDQSQQISLTKNISSSPIKRKYSLKSPTNQSPIQEFQQAQPTQLEFIQLNNEEQNLQKVQFQGGDNQIGSPSIKSLANLNQIYSNLNSFSNLEKIEKLQTNQKQLLQSQQLGQSDDHYIKKNNIEYNFKDKIQKFLHSRKSSLVNPISSNTSLNRNQKEDQQNEQMHAINILNLQQYIDLKRKNSSIFNHQKQNLQNQQNIQQQQQQQQTANNFQDIYNKDNECIQKQKNMQQDGSYKDLQNKSNSYYTSLNSENQRLNAQLLNQMLKRSHQCKFKVLNDQKIQQQQYYQINQSAKSNERKFGSTANILAAQNGFYTNVNSPTEQIPSHVVSANNSFTNQGYFINKKANLSSLSPSKSTSKQQKRAFHQLTQSINVSKIFQQQQINCQQKQNSLSFANIQNKKQLLQEQLLGKSIKNKSNIQESVNQMQSQSNINTFLSNLIQKTKY